MTLTFILYLYIFFVWVFCIILFCSYRKEMARADKAEAERNTYNRLYESTRNDLGTAVRELAILKTTEEERAEMRKLAALNPSIDEALNSRDGTYKP